MEDGGGMARSIWAVSQGKPWLAFPAATSIQVESEENKRFDAPLLRPSKHLCFAHVVDVISGQGSLHLGACDADGNVQLYSSASSAWTHLGVASDRAASVHLIHGPHVVVGDENCVVVAGSRHLWPNVKLLAVSSMLVGAAVVVAHLIGATRNDAGEIFLVRLSCRISRGDTTQVEFLPVVNQPSIPLPSQQDVSAIVLGSKGGEPDISAVACGPSASWRGDGGAVHTTQLDEDVAAIVVLPDGRACLQTKSAWFLVGDSAIRLCAVSATVLLHDWDLCGNLTAIIVENVNRTITRRTIAAAHSSSSQSTSSKEIKPVSAPPAVADTLRRTLLQQDAHIRTLQARLASQQELLSFASRSLERTLGSSLPALQFPQVGLARGVVSSRVRWKAAQRAPFPTGLTMGQRPFLAGHAAFRHGSAIWVAILVDKEENAKHGTIWMQAVTADGTEIATNSLFYHNRNGLLVAKCSVPRQGPLRVRALRVSSGRIVQQSAWISLSSLPLWYGSAIEWTKASIATITVEPIAPFINAHATIWDSLGLVSCGPGLPVMSRDSTLLMSVSPTCVISLLWVAHASDIQSILSVLRQAKLKATLVSPSTDPLATEALERALRVEMDEISQGDQRTKAVLQSDTDAAMLRLVSTR